MQGSGGSHLSRRLQLRASHHLLAAGQKWKTRPHQMLPRLTSYADSAKHTIDSKGSPPLRLWLQGLPDTLHRRKTGVITACVQRQIVTMARAAPASVECEWRYSANSVRGLYARLLLCCAPACLAWSLLIRATTPQMQLGSYQMRCTVAWHAKAAARSLSLGPYDTAS